MEPSSKFSGGVAKANLILSLTPILHEAWQFISDCQRSPRPIKWAVTNLGRFKILAFNSGSRREDVEPNLQSLDKGHPLGFLITKDNSSVALDSTLLSTFDRLTEKPDLTDKLRQLTSDNQPRLIIVGHSEGGAVAALVTLWLLKNRCSPALPICITYGSPFIGNKGLQTAIGKIEQCKSQFWHVLSRNDPVISCCGFPPSENDPHKQLMPFGTYLLLSESGYACIDDPNLVFKLLSRIDSAQTEPKDYGGILRQLEQRIICRKPNIQLAASDDSLTVDLALQLETLEIGYSRQDLQAMKERRRSGTKGPTHNSKMLNDMKIKMAQLEWFKKDCEDGKNNYYDRYKRKENFERPNINVRTQIKDVLVAYWVKEVDKAANKPPTRDAHMRDRWLFAGNNYRRMVEPLAIAEHYKKGGNDYLQQRLPHFVILEKWEDEDAAKKKKVQKGKSTAASLTHDSCFWARVEEAAIKLRELEKAGEAKEDIRKELVEFEEYIMKLVGNYQLACDAFFEQSSFMVWWEEYSKMLNREKPDNAQDSPLFAFMAKGGYINYVRSTNCEQYVPAAVCSAICHGSIGFN